MGLLAPMWSSVRKMGNFCSHRIPLRGLTGWRRSLLSVLWASRGVLPPIAKAACHAAGRLIAPFTSTITSTILASTSHLTIDGLEQMAAKLQSYMASLSFAEPDHVPPFLCLPTSATVVKWRERAKCGDGPIKLATGLAQ